LKQTYTISEKLKQLLIIFGPILLSQLCLFAAQFVNTSMAGHASPTDLAGVGIGGANWVPFQVGLNGILLAVTPIISKMLGANEDPEKRLTFALQASYVSLIMGIIGVLAIQFLLIPNLGLLSAEQDILLVAKQYLYYYSFGQIPLFLFIVIRCFFDAHGKTFLSMIISASVLPINILLNYLLVFGNWGMPRLGGAGTGIATAVSYWVILIIALIILFKLRIFKIYQPFFYWQKINFSVWKKLFKTGIPIGLAIFFEISIFSVVTLLINGLPEEIIAAHLSAMNFSGILFMLPLSLASAMTIVVGFEYGAKRFHDAKIYSQIGIVLTLIFSLLSAGLLLLFREPIAHMYADKAEVEVIALITQFLIYAAIFQLSDGFQASIQGMLRGYQDVKFALYLTFTSYWLIGLPVGYYFAKYTTLSAFGYWIGFIVGLTVCSVGMFARLRRVEKKYIVEKVQLT